MDLTLAHVESLAPDAASLKAAGKLTGASKWSETGRTDALLWGACRGSGKTPYEVKVERAAGGFHCSCPSRKFPCKHVLALLTIAATQPSQVAETETPPAWAADWLAARREKAASKKPAKAKKPPNAEAAAKRQAARESKVDAGLDQLALWMRDLIREGLAGLSGQGAEPWVRQAKRLNDAQAPALATTIERIGERVDRGDDWPARVLADLGGVQLLIDAYRNPSLPDPLREEVRQLIGFPVAAGSLTADPIDDVWAVVGQVTDREQTLAVQRTWLVGRGSGRAALVLQFAHGSQPFAQPLVAGSDTVARVVPYPGASGLRVKIEEPAEVTPLRARVAGSETIEAFLVDEADRLATQPWSYRSLVCLQNVSLVPPGFGGGEGWRVRDHRGDCLPVAAADPWTIVAGGGAFDLFAEWDGETLAALGVWEGIESDAGQWRAA